MTIASIKNNILPHLPRSRRNRFILLFIIASVAFFAVIVTITRFDIKGRYEGIFLLREKPKNFGLFELKDDLYLGDGSRLLFAIDLKKPKYTSDQSSPDYKTAKPFIFFSWDAKDGSGFVRNFFGDGTRMVTCFSRFDDEAEDNLAHGLIVGGGLPPNIEGDDETKMSETGMAYFNGKCWFHIWCNANEGFTSLDTAEKSAPSDWTFLGSKVLNSSSDTVALMSSHEVDVDGVPLHLDRYAYFRAGRPYFKLGMKITNLGDVPAHFTYVYGDEPWVGKYGSSKGNVGWTKDRLYENVEWVDTTKYNYAGFFDYGRSNDSHNYTMAANFIEWYPTLKPNVYFSNGPMDSPMTHPQAVAMDSNERFISVEFPVPELLPGKSTMIFMAIGMAGTDPQTGFPVKPEVNWYEAADLMK
jgi:hypothetical protein